MSNSLDGLFLYVIKLKNPIPKVKHEKDKLSNGNIHFIILPDAYNYHRYFFNIFHKWK